MTDGIYTFANDVVYDQLVALLNSIEVNGGRELPVCIIPYNNQLDKIRAEVAKRNLVTLFDNQESIAFWENFMTQAWKANQTAQKGLAERGLSSPYRLAMHRKLCSINGPFDKFVYFDADTLLMGPLDAVYEKLDQYDWVTNDFQYKSDIKYIFDRPEGQFYQVFDPQYVKSHIFCAGWFASKRGIFTQAILDHILHNLKMGESDAMALFGPDQSLLNYMVLRSNISFYNFAYHNLEQATGSHWSSTFDVVDNVLYDKGKKITYIHFMSISAGKFTQLCGGEDVKIPYQDVFLHYRYLKSPSDRPQLKPPSWLVQVQRNLKNAIAKISDRVISKIRKIKRGLS